MAILSQILVQVLILGLDYSNIRGLRANLDTLAVAGSGYAVLVCAESKVSDRHHLSEPCIPGFGCPQQRLRNSTPVAQGMALYVREGFRSFRYSKMECSCQESYMFRICNRINNFYVYALYCGQGTMVHSMTVSLTLWFRCNQLMKRRSLSLLVMPMLITLRGYSQSLILIDMVVMLLIFCTLSGCEQLVRCPTHIAGNRLDLVMTNVPDIVDVIVGTLLSISDHCFVSYVLRVEQSVPEYKVRSTVFLKYRTNWDSVWVNSEALPGAPF